MKLNKHQEKQKNSFIMILFMTYIAWSCYQLAKENNFLQTVFVVYLVGALFLILAFGKLFFKNELDDTEEPDIDNKLENENSETRFKEFFNEGKYEDFKSKAIEVGIINKELKWIYSNVNTDAVVLFNILNENDFIKPGYILKSYHDISNKVFELNVDYTMYSRPNLKKFLKEHLSGSRYEKFLVFFNDNKFFN